MKHNTAILLAASAVSAPVLAQSASDAKGLTAQESAPEQYTTSPGGVDMRTGVYTYREVDLKVGDEHGLELVRQHEETTPGHANPFGNFSHNWGIHLKLNYESYNSTWGASRRYTAKVHVGGRAFMFEATEPDGDYRDMSKSFSAHLEAPGPNGQLGLVHTFRSEDQGIKIIFRPTGLYDCGGSASCAYPDRMILADGTNLVFAYDTRTSGSNRARLRSVTSTRGYKLVFDYGHSDWGLVTRSCVLNLAAQGDANESAMADRARTSYQYTYFRDKYRLASVIEADDATHTFAYAQETDPARFQMSYTKPGASSPWLVNTLEQVYASDRAKNEIVHRQAFSDGTTLAYTWYRSPQSTHTPISQPKTIVAGGQYTDSAGATTIVEYGFPELPWSETRVISNYDPTPSDLRDTDDDCYECSGASGQRYATFYQITPGPARVVDALGRETAYEYCDPGFQPVQNEPYQCLVGPVQSVRWPNGKLVHFTYEQKKLIGVREVDLNGVQADLIRTQASGCGHWLCGTKPVWTIDGNHQRTDYTYSPEHGGLLARTEPALNGVRSQVRYRYTGRYAWIRTPAGGYVRAASPVWVLAGEEYCRTSAAVNVQVTSFDAQGDCAAGSADEVVTTYDYGPDSGPNTLLLRGVAVTASGQTRRTCYGYDALGRSISETSPQADLSACP